MDISSIAKQVSTPAYCFDARLFERRAKEVREAFGPGIGLCFSIKANPFLLWALPDVFDRIEVCSPGELTLCERAGVDMQKVVYSGVNKGPEDIARAIRDGVGVLTAESPRHYRLICEEALRSGKTVPVLLRLTAGTQFGMDESDILSLIEHRDHHPEVTILGLHFFSGTQKKKMRVLEKETERLRTLCAKLKADYDFDMQWLEYGAGLAADYFCPDPDAEEAQRLSEAAEVLRALGAEYPLTVEMGRFFAAPCGFYFTKVVDTKLNQGLHYAIVDGGIHQLKYDGQLQGMQIPPITHLPLQTGEPATAESASETETASADDPTLWTLCGSLCTTADVLARGVPLRSLAVGDTLVFRRVGAYSAFEGIALLLSRDLPEVWLIDLAGKLQKMRGRIDTDPLNGFETRK